MVASKSTKRLYIADYSLSTNANVGAQLRPVRTEAAPAPETQVRRRILPRITQPIGAFTTLTEGQAKRLAQHLQAHLSQAQTVEIHTTRPALEQELLSLLWSGLSQSINPQASISPASPTPSARLTPEPSTSALQSSMLRAPAPRSQAFSLPDIAYINAQNSPLSDLQQEICETFYQKPQSLKFTPQQVAHYLDQLKAWLVVGALDLSPAELRRLLKSVPNCKLIYTSHKPLKNQATGEYLSKLVSDSGYSQYLHQLQNSIQALSKLERQLLTVLAPLKGIAIQRQTILALFEASLKDSFSKSQLAAAIASLTQQNLLCETEKGYLQIHPGAVSSNSPNSTCINATLVSVSSWIQAVSNDPGDLCNELRLVHWAIAQTRDQGDWKELLSLLRATESGFIHRHWWGRWAQVLFWKLEAAQHLDDKSAIAWVHHQLGSRALCLGDWSAAQTHLDRALILRQSYGDAVGAAATSRHLDILIAPTTRASEFVRSSDSAPSTTTGSTTQSQGTHGNATSHGSTGSRSTGSDPAQGNPAPDNVTSSNPNPIAIPVATIAPTLIKSVTTVALLTGGSGLLWTGAQQIQTGFSSPQADPVASASQESNSAQQDNTAQNRLQISAPTPQSPSEPKTEAEALSPSSTDNAESDLEASDTAEANDDARSGRSVTRIKSPIQSTLAEKAGIPAEPAPAKTAQPAAVPSPTAAKPDSAHCLVGRWTSDLSDPMRGDAFLGDRAILTSVIQKLGKLGGQDLSNEAGHIGQMLTNSDYRDRVLGRQDLIAALEAQQSSQPRLDISIRHADTQGNIELSISKDGSLVSTYQNLSHGFDVSYSVAPETPLQSHQIRWQLDGQMTAQASFSDEHNRITYSNPQWNVRPSLNQGQSIQTLPAIDNTLSAVSQSLKPLETLQPATYSCNNNELALNMTLEIEQQALNFVRRYRRLEN